MTIEPEPTVDAVAPDLVPQSLEENLRRRVSMLTQLLIVASIVVMLQFGIMLKVLIETSK